MTQDITDKLDALFAPYNRSDEPGCTVAIARAGGVIYRRAYGLACIASGAANRPSTLMPIGSVAKQFTCAALLLLAADGRLSLDDAVDRWLPELPEAQRTPTLVQLMRHQGGVRCYLDQWMCNGYRTLPAGMAWDIQRRQESPNFAPGSRSAYSNGGYLILSMVVERASGVAFAEFVRRRLFTPCGMQASLFPAKRTETLPDLATAYMLKRTGVGWTAAPAMTEDSYGDGGMISTVDDLMRWARFLRNGDGPVSLAALLAPTEPWAPGPSDYRFGLIAQQWRGARLVQHGGGLPGANSAFVMLPDHDIDIAILFNRPAPATSIALSALEIVLGEELPKDARPPATADYTDLIGSYFSSDDGLLFGLSDNGGRLALSLFGDGLIPLEQCAAEDSDLPFWADVGAAQMRFRRSPSPQAIEYFDGKAWNDAVRLEGAPPSSDQIVAGAAGEFLSADASATLGVVVRDGGLRVRVRGEIGNGDYLAEPIAADLIRFWPPLFPGGKLVRLIRSGTQVRSIVVSTPRTRALEFTRIDAPANWSSM